MITSSTENDRPLYLGLYKGRVVDVADPESLHRVRLKVPGIVEPTSEWAPPMALGAGSAQRGGNIVPAVGSLVGVMFLGGCKESPVYLGGIGWSKPASGSQAPADVKDLPPEEAPKVSSWQLGRLKFTVDERGAAPKLVVEDTVSEDAFQWDVGRNLMQLEASAGIFLKSSGTIRIDAVEVIVNGRPAAVSPKAW